jgi:uncharacterized glyoxalase superfamily protein PhnB
MKMIPLLRVRSMEEAIAFYTTVLDFELKYPGTADDDWVVDLVNGSAELQLTSLEGNQKGIGIAVNVRVEEVDELFAKFLKRGLVRKEGSPVHQAPLNQTWGMREFYVTDPSGNTLRYGRPIE